METLGSLVDKLTIKNIRLYFLETGKYSTTNTEEKIKVVKEQREDLLKEIDQFLVDAVAGRVKLKDLKVKLYNAPSDVARASGIAELVSALSVKNLDLWHLEDEVRRKDIPDSEVVAAKRKIDKANQERCDLIDGIDTTLEEVVKNAK